MFFDEYQSNNHIHWGTWSKKSAGEKGKLFTVLCQNINETNSPLEIDHIDFINFKCFKEEK